MNKKTILLVSFFAAFLAAALPSAALAQARRVSSDIRGEQFYVISSVDMQKHQIVLMHPTQLTVVATVNDQTAYLGEKGEKVGLKDLHAGQTVWAILRKDNGSQISAVRIREGAMTVAQLHKLYLDYPAQ